MELKNRKRTSKKQKLGSEGTEQGFQRKQVGLGRKKNRRTGTGFKAQEGILRKEEEIQGTRRVSKIQDPRDQKRSQGTKERFQDRRWSKRQKEDLRDKKKPEVWGLRDSRVLESEKNLSTWKLICWAFSGSTAATCW